MHFTTAELRAAATRAFTATLVAWGFAAIATLIGWSCVANCVRKSHTFASGLAIVLIAVASLVATVAAINITGHCIKTAEYMVTVKGGLG
jgi:hypothetical protein